MKIGTIALTALTSLAGSIAGNGARMIAQEWMRRERLAAAGEEPESEQIVITGVISNVVAATAIASMLPKNNALYGFAIGMALSAATGDSVDRWMAVGIALIVGSGLLTLIRERKRGTSLPPPVAGQSEAALAVKPDNPA